MTRIVVGIDGSPASEAALHWALVHAVALGGEVHALMSWNEHPLLAGVSETLGGGVPLDVVEEQSKGLLDATIAAATPDGNTVTITREAVSGSPADVLIDAAVEADMIVVGRHAKRGVLHLGSVSTRVAREASCPVVVVPSR